MEVALRIADFSYQSTWRFNPVTGKSLLEGSKMWYREEGNVFVEINSDGLRDVEHAIEKPATIDMPIGVPREDPVFAIGC